MSDRAMQDVAWLSKRWYRWPNCVITELVKTCRRRHGVGGHEMARLTKTPICDGDQTQSCKAQSCPVGTSVSDRMSWSRLMSTVSYLAKTRIVTVSCRQTLAQSSPIKLCMTLD